MKKIELLTILVVAFIFSSCGKDSLGVSRVTTYATMTLKGDASLWWPLGTTFVDPGCTAFEGTTDISKNVTAISNVDGKTGGIFTITYKVANSDGFMASTTRTVYVYDPNAALNGIYTSNISRNNSGTIAKRGPFAIKVFGVGSNKYWIEDLLGGWYYLGSGYGFAYAGYGVISLNADNTFSVVSARTLPWGAPCGFNDVSTYDPTSKTILIHSIMMDTPTMKFTVTLNNPTALK